MHNPLVFITGITGFVGQNLSLYLTKDFDVQGISRKGNPEGLSYKTFLEENSPYYAIIHLAGKAHDLKKVANPQEYYEANFELTKQLFDAFLESEASAFIFMSTVKAVADELEGILTEDSISNPKTHYGISKLYAENYILSKELPKEKSVYILRPCMIHGPGNKGNLNLLYQIVKKGFPWPLGAYENKRSFLSIDNLLFVIKQLIENEIPSGVYNVADDEALSTNELIGLIAASQHKKARIVKISTKLIGLVAKIGNVLHLPLNEERLGKLTESYEISNRKIKAALGITKMPVSAREGFVKTFNSFNKKIKNYYD